MSWAKQARLELREGNTVQVKPKGNSMEPLIKSGALVTLEPIDAAKVKQGDVVLVRIKGRDYLHLVKARRGAQLLIGNNKGGINGWVGPHAIFGITTTIDNG